MRTAIIAAMDEEVQFLIAYIDKHEKYEFQGYEYHIGEIAGEQIVLCKSGIGKVNAALSTTLLLEHFKVDTVINTGSAGALKPYFNVGDVLIADRCIYHDVDATAFGYKYGQVPQMPEYYICDDALVEAFSKIFTAFSYKHYIGTIATGDSFMTDVQKFKELEEQLPNVLAVDMEATAITQVCTQYRKPFIIVRSISDIVSKDSGIAFNEFIALAAKNSTEVIKAFLLLQAEQRKKAQNESE